MQTQKRLFRSGTMIVLLLFLFSISGTLSTIKQDNPQSGSPVLAADTPESIPPTPTVEPPKFNRVVIDPGHGGKDPGANGASGKEEKDYTLSLARQICELLRQEPLYVCEMTRTDDSFIGLEDRAKFANELKADALISIHGNTYIEDQRVAGTETYYYSEDSIQLAQLVHDHLVSAMGFRDRNLRKLHWKVLTFSEMPAVLAEVGFLTNKNEEAAMLSQKGQADAAKAIADAIKQYFTNKKNKQAVSLEEGEPAHGQ
jgi:N-acetylmuramoyl-L-alanine amidase